MRTKLTLLSAVLSMSFLMTSQANAVVSGDYVLEPQKEVPWVLSIWLETDDDEEPQFICSASLFKPQLVLSAAHCFQGLKGNFFVEYGARKLGQGTLVPIDSYWISPRYNKLSIVNDLAIAHTLIPIPSSTFPSLDTTTTAGKSGTKATVFGWGADQNDEVTGDLRKSLLEFSPSSAARTFGSAFNAKTNLAAGKYIKSEKIYTAACHGDSGGPLITGTTLKPVIVGVVSYGPAESCNLKIPTVFSRVGYYKADISSGSNYVNSRSQTDSIAAPMNLAPPQISGNTIPNSKLVCSLGSWTENAKDFEIKWYLAQTRNNYTSIQGNKDGTLTLDRDYFPYPIWCSVKATSKNQKSAYANTSFSLPDLEPTIELVSPKSNSVVTGKFEIRIQFASGTKSTDIISKLCLLLNGKSIRDGSDESGCFRVYDSDTLNLIVDGTNLKNGNIDLSLYGLTNAGNQFGKQIYSFSLQNDDPVASFVEPEANSTVSGKFTLKATAKPSSKGTASIAKSCLLLNGKLLDQGYFQYYYSLTNNQDTKGCYSSNSQEPSWDFDTTKWTNGTYEFSFYTVDSSGRISATVKRSFVFSN